MKKSLLALAVLGAFAGAASAQSNVTVYGVFDIGLAHENNGVNSVNRMDSGNQSGSRLGFKGSEDLGGGLSAVFQIETGFNGDTGTLGQGGRIFGRQSYVGLNGGFGSVKLGRQYTPLFLALDTIDPMGTGLTGGGSGITSLFNPGTGDVRMSNTIDYSITAGPISAELAYGLGEVAGSSSGNRQIGASLAYANGPITGVLGYHNGNDATGNDSAKTTMLGGTYNFGVATAHAAYAWNKGFGSLDTRDAMLGVSVPVGAGTILGSYLHKSDKARSNADANQWAVAYLHSLSKRTNLYTSYSRNANDSQVAYNSGGNGLTGTLFNVGIRHKF